jgi:hypothetical protein
MGVSIDVAKSRNGLSVTNRRSAGVFSVKGFSVGCFNMATRRVTTHGTVRLDPLRYHRPRAKEHHLHPLAGFSLTKTVPGVGVDDGGGIAGAGGVCDVHES